MAKRQAREAWVYDTMADFVADGGAAAYGDGQVIIADQVGVVFNGVLTLSGNTSGSGVYLNDPQIALARYRSLPNESARRIAWIGDSTVKHIFLQSVGSFPVMIANDGTSYVEKVFGYPGGPMYQVTHGDFGENGRTLSSFIAGTALYDVADIAAFDPHLIHFTYGINDVRLGATSKAQLMAMLVTAINMLQAAVPNADIILRMPNSLLYDATNTLGYIDAPTSMAKVQAYSDILRGAYRALIGQFPHVYVLDTQSGPGQIWPEKVQTQPGIYMAAANDALHPIGEGYCAMLRETMLLLGDYGTNRYPKVASGVLPLLPRRAVAVSEHAAAVTADAHLVSPRICEDPSKYNLILDGGFVNGSTASTYIDVFDQSGSPAKRLLSIPAVGDIVVQYGVKDAVSGPQGEATEAGVAAWKLTAVSKSVIGNSIRMAGLPAGYPRAQNYPNPVRIFRPRPATQKYDADQNVALAFGANDFTAATYQQTAQRAGAIGNISATAGVAPTTGGTIAIAVNGTTVETLSFANNATTATGAGAFAGIWLDEGDVITATVNGGFVSGSKLRIKISNR